jgi:hypothetical protein
MGMRIKCAAAWRRKCVLYVGTYGVVYSRDMNTDFKSSPDPTRGALSWRASLSVPGGFRSSCICAVANKSHICDNTYVSVYRELFIIASPVILYTQHSLAFYEDSWK